MNSAQFNTLMDIANQNIDLESERVINRLVYSIGRGEITIIC